MNILSASKNILQVTRSQLHLEKLAKQKFELRDSITSQLHYIADTVARLQQELPHQDLLKEFHAQPQRSIAQKHETVSPVAPPSLSEIDKLNEAILSIEKKLANLK
jgi:hypothetical protein